MARGRPFQPGQSGNPNGRPTGAIALRTRQLRDKAKRLGCDPIDVMINEIRDLLLEAKRHVHSEEKRRMARTQAVEVAAKLAPYLHPKLATIELHGEIDHRHDVQVQVTVMRDDLLREVDHHAKLIEHVGSGRGNGTGNGSDH